MIQIVVVMFLYWGHDRVPVVWGWLLCGLVWEGYSFTLNAFSLALERVRNNTCHFCGHPI